jgi:hypothetical protein
MTFWIPFGFIMGLLNVALLYSLSKATHTSTNLLDENGRHTLRVTRAYHYLGISMLVVGGLFVVIILLKKGTDPTALQVVSGVFSGCALVGLWTMLYAQKHFVVFDTAHIYIHKPFRKTRILPWDALSRISLNHFTSSYVLTTKDKHKISINQHLVGFPVFKALAEARGIRTT